MADCLREACQLRWAGDARWADCLDRLRLPDAAACELKESIETRRDNAMSADDLYQQARLLALDAYSAADIREYACAIDVADVPTEAEIEEVLRAVKEVQAADQEADTQGQLEKAKQAERDAQEAHNKAEKEAKEVKDKLLQEERKCEQAAKELRQLEKLMKQLEEEKEQLEQKEREAQRELEELQEAERRTKEISYPSSRTA
eukprot:TRINITY_DN793_c0_g1_i4.p2 TRINITY_DN793_c0_g1~~TRINITY_DN793_c0_g1_i4.p2  ORF type:complete len:203 (+),score=77.50 TRINITY_DN793_c0_g1_i4:49-657(+)